MISLIFEIPVTIGAIELSKIVFLDPLFKVASPYFKTDKNDADNYSTYFKILTAVTLYYYIFNNFLYFPTYFLHIIIGTIIVLTILCNFTPLWEILTTSFNLDLNFIDFINFTNVKDNFLTKYRYALTAGAFKTSTHKTSLKTSIIEDFNNSLVGDLIPTSRKRRISFNERNKFLQFGIYLSKDNKFSNILKKNYLFNQNVQQNVQPNAIIIMNASVLVKLTRLLSVTPKPRSYNKKFSRHRRNSLLICDSQNQSNEKVKEEIHVAPPSDLFLSEKISELDKELVDLTENKNQIDDVTKRIQDLIDQKQQYQVQAQENIISKDVTKLSIPAFTIKQENNYKKFAVYVIMVQRLDASTGQVKAGWIVPRRYNEFSSLNQHTMKNYSEFVKKFEFPGKTLFNSLNNSFLESRRVQLESYLQNLLINDEICENKEFLKFLSKEK